MKLKIVVLNVLFILLISQAFAGEKLKTREINLIKIKTVLHIDKIMVDENVSEKHKKVLKNNEFITDVLSKIHEFLSKTLGSDFEKIFSKNAQLFNLRFVKTQEVLKEIYKKDPKLFVDDLLGSENIQQDLSKVYTNEYTTMMQNNKDLIEQKRITHEELDQLVKDKLLSILWNGFMEGKNSSSVGGWSSQSTRTIFVFEIPSFISENIKTNQELINTYSFIIAHEIGHLVGHLKHPDSHAYGERNLMDLTSLKIDDIKSMNLVLHRDQIQEMLFN